MALAIAPPIWADAPAPQRSTARYEVNFMQDMIDHHAMAIEMGETCLERAVHEKLRVLCGDIISAQSSEIDTMQGWLAEWYGASHEPEMSKKDQEMLAELSALEGAEFEIAFMEQMIEHHSRAVDRGERCIDRAYHDELVALCENIVETQTAEIELMQGWLCDWYEHCQT